MLWLRLLGLILETDGLINKQLALNPGVPGNGTRMGTWTQLRGGESLIRLLGVVPGGLTGPGNLPGMQWDPK